MTGNQLLTNSALAGTVEEEPLPERGISITQPLRERDLESCHCTLLQPGVQSGVMAGYVRLLGTPQVRLREEWLEPSPGKTSAVLYYLVYQGRWVSRDELLYLFWPDSAETPARSNLRKLLSGIRRLAYTGDLEIEPTRLRWPICTDVSEFKQALAEKDLSRAVQPSVSIWMRHLPPLKLV